MSKNKPQQPESGREQPPQQQRHKANEDGMLVRKPSFKGLPPLNPKLSKTQTKKERG